MNKFIIAALAFAPALASAQSTGNPQPLGNLRGLLSAIGGLIDLALPIVVALALLTFFWGLVRYIWGAEDKKTEGLQFMGWGLLALFVMIAVWGLVRFIGSALGVNPEANPVVVPDVPLNP